MHMKKLKYILLITLAGLITLRIALEPKETPFSTLPAYPDKSTVQKIIENNKINMEQLLEEIRTKRIILLGETHFVKETMEFLTNLATQLEKENLVLLLELPSDAQNEIDQYRQNGDEALIQKIFSRGNALPYQQTLRWSFANKQYISKVIAFDEPRWHVVLMRLFATDTRNQSMAEAILQEYDSKNTMIVFGGQLHMTMAGRYRYDAENREPVGSLLVHMGIPRNDIVSIMLSGGDRFPSYAAWNSPGISTMHGELGSLPIAFFISDPVFRAKTSAELFDYFIHLGPLSPVSEKNE